MPNSAGSHPLIEEIVRCLPALHLAPPAGNPFARKTDRAGWFGCSGLGNPPKQPFRARKLLSDYFGLPYEEFWDAETVWRIDLGSAIDAILGAAMQQSPMFISTQATLEDEDLHLRGTPDFIVDWCGEAVIGDVKSSDSATTLRYYASNDWPLSKHASWRQLQAYLMLSDTDWGFVVFAEQRGLTSYAWDDLPAAKTVADLLHVRRFQRDEKCVAGILRDLAYLNEKREQVAEALARGEDPGPYLPTDVLR